MSKPVNLRLARKAKARVTAREAGDANAAQSGLSKAQKQAAERDKARSAEILEAHKRDHGKT